MKYLHESRILLFVLAVLVQLIPTARTWAAPAPKTEGAYPSNGHSIGVTRFDPAGPGPHPAIVLLHGLDGADTNRQTYEDLAGRLTARGYVVFFVRYFELFGNREAELAFFRANAKQHLMGPDCLQRQRLWIAFQGCLTVVSDGVRYVQKQPGVDVNRVGILGFSLGGFLAVSTATQKELKIKAVAELFGGLPRELHEVAEVLPPTLVIHGDQDRIVPVVVAHGLAKVLQAKQRVHEVEVYNGVGHVFVGDDGKFATWSALQAEWRVMTFLQRNMK